MPTLSGQRLAACDRLYQLHDKQGSGMSTYYVHNDRWHSLASFDLNWIECQILPTLADDQIENIQFTQARWRHKKPQLGAWIEPDLIRVGAVTAVHADRASLEPWRERLALSNIDCLSVSTDKLLLDVDGTIFVPNYTGLIGRVLDVLIVQGLEEFPAEMAVHADNIVSVMKHIAWHYQIAVILNAGHPVTLPSADITLTAETGPAGIPIFLQQMEK